MCSASTDETGTSTWCGIGWTGQPNVIPRPKGKLELRFGAYDRRYHFLDASTGREVRPPLLTGDLAKGSATSDPDGFPLYYAGSRDNSLRVVALDRRRPTVLWKLDSYAGGPVTWNDDWDGAPLVVKGHLLVGGENSWFYVVRLNRGYDRHGKVRVRPRVVARVPSWDGRLLAARSDRAFSIESSVAYDRGIAYFANSAGLVQGWDVRQTFRRGNPPRRVFRFWMGDDTDALGRHRREGLPVRRQRARAVHRPLACGRSAREARPSSTGVAARLVGAAARRSVAAARAARGRRPPSSATRSTSRRTPAASSPSTAAPVAPGGRCPCPGRPGGRRWSSTACSSRAIAAATSARSTSPGADRVRSGRSGSAAASNRPLPSGAGGSTSGRAAARSTRSLRARESQAYSPPSRTSGAASTAGLGTEAPGGRTACASRSPARRRRRTRASRARPRAAVHRSLPSRVATPCHIAIGGTPRAKWSATSC